MRMQQENSEQEYRKSLEQENAALELAIQRETKANLAKWEFLFTSATVLQEIVGRRAGRANRSTEAAQGTERQNSTQHPSNHFLCPEAGSRAAADRPQSGRRLCTAEGGAQIRFDLIINSADRIYICSFRNPAF